MKILNLTQHDTTDDQLKDGVIEPVSPSVKGSINKMLAFDRYASNLPTKREIEGLVKILVMIFENERFFAEANGDPLDGVMLGGGATFIIGTLERALKKNDVRIFYPVYRCRDIKLKGKDGVFRSIQSDDVDYIGLVEV